MPISPDALLGALITVGLAGLVGMWKLATMLAEVRSQVRHNGGTSLKDDARTAAQEAVRARELAEQVAVDLVTFRGHQADDAAARARQIARVAHDVTNIQAGQEMLMQQQLVTDQRVTDHRARNEATVAALTAVVAEIDRASTARDEALGTALRESLDVAIAVEDAQEDR